MDYQTWFSWVPCELSIFVLPPYLREMLEEPQFCSSRVLSPFREESGDEELSVLPRHTKVIVTGNNRTKSVLVGLQGVVKKAVGLGGWHWLVYLLSYASVVLL